MRAWLDREERTAGIDRQVRLRQTLVWTSGAALAIGMALRLTGIDAGPVSAGRLAEWLFIVSLAAGIEGDIAQSLDRARASGRSTSTCS